MKVVIYLYYCLCYSEFDTTAHLKINMYEGQIKNILIEIVLWKEEALDHTKLLERIYYDFRQYLQMNDWFSNHPLPYVSWGNFIFLSSLIKLYITSAFHKMIKHIQIKGQGRNQQGWYSLQTAACSSTIAALQTLLQPSEHK